MATFSKYKLYELYETDDGINWFPMGEYKAVLSEMYSEDCGYSARTITETVDDCSGTTKVITIITKYQESYDSGTTWITTSSTSNVTYEENSSDCGYSARTITETVDDCSGTTKVITNITKYQESYDSGATWITTSSTSSVTYEENSVDCGYSARTIVDYDDECSGTTKVITATTKYQESYDSGITWITTSSTSSVTYEENSLDCGYTPKDYSQEYLTFVAKDSGTFRFSGTTSGTTSNKISYSTDSGTTWSTPAQVVSVNVNNGDVVMWKGEMTPTNNGIGRFSGGTASFDILGNIMSMLYGDNFDNQTSLGGKNYVFYMLFNATKVLNAENLILPATTLANYCYDSMFYYCTSLTTAPQLTATTLAESCYQSMFSNCTSLTTAPQLPATTLAEGCYHQMFFNCTSLTTAPQLPATTLSSNCYNGMFNGCTSLTTAPQLLATTLAQNCYAYMFCRCTSLTTAPQLLVTTLTNSCYAAMFMSCTSLTTAPQLPATTLAQNCYSSMFEGCTSLTTAPQLPATTLATSAYTHMFYDCTSLTTAPELPATTLAPYCYSYTFYNCRNLNYIKMLATDISANSCLTNWVRYVASSGTFVKDANTTIPTGANGIPNNWTVQNA